MAYKKVPYNNCKSCINTVSNRIIILCTLLEDGHGSIEVNLKHLLVYVHCEKCISIDYSGPHN